MTSRPRSRGGGEEVQFPEHVEVYALFLSRILPGPIQPLTRTKHRPQHATARRATTHTVSSLAVLSFLSTIHHKGLLGC